MKALRRRLPPVLLILALLAGCTPVRETEPEGMKLWFVAADGGHSAALASQEYTGVEAVDSVMAALLAGPEGDSALTSPIPAGTRLLGWTLEEGILQVNLSQPYDELVGVELTLADYCITLTLAQLPGVYGVIIKVNGGELALRDRQVLYPGDVVFSGAEEEPVEVYAALYFRRGDGDTLGFEQRSFRLTESEQPALAVLQALLGGPEDEGLTALLPEGVEVYSTHTDDGLCVVDLSAAFWEAVPEDPREQTLMVWSIVNTLCSLETVDSVRLLAEGEERAAYGGVDLTEPLTADDGLTG